jgi:tetratricopeptide (TPR) repeat protein
MVEKEVLGIERVDDIPGFLAPMIYFDFIESKQPEGMLGILKHNEVDILSLVTLYTHLTLQLCSKDQAQTRMESYEVGRWYASLGERDEAKKVMKTLANGNDLTSGQAKLELAYQMKKSHVWDQALNLFLEAADSNFIEVGLEACIEAAKILEHKQKNFNSAIDYCVKARAMLEKAETMKAKDASLLKLEKRLERLEKKSLKFPE